MQIFFNKIIKTQIHLKNHYKYTILHFKQEINKINFLKSESLFIHDLVLPELNSIYEGDFTKHLNRSPLQLQGAEAHTFLLLTFMSPTLFFILFFIYLLSFM